MTSRRCVIPGCWTLGEHDEHCPRGKCRGCAPRIYERPMVCTSCRAKLEGELADIAALDAARRAEVEELAPGWLPAFRLPVPTTDPGRLAPWVLVAAGRHLDEVMPVGPVRVGSQARVSGTREQPAPVSLDLLDLGAQFRPASRALFARGLLGLDPDQVGTLSAATILDGCARTWRDALWPDQRLPEPTVPVLVGWLADRLQDACDRFEAVDEFAGEISDLRAALRKALGLADAQPELCQGVACRVCDRMNTIYRDGPHIQCRLCAHYYDEREYRDWVALLDADTRQRMNEGKLTTPAGAEPKAIAQVPRRIELRIPAPHGVVFAPDALNYQIGTYVLVRDANGRQWNGKVAAAAVDKDGSGALISVNVPDEFAMEPNSAEMWRMAV